VGEVVRLYLINTANTRIFNVSVRGARMKLVGGDSGRCEREAFVDDVLLAPSERAIVDVLFSTPGEARLEHRTPDRVYDLGRFLVEGTHPEGARRTFDSLRTDPELASVRASIGRHVDREPDKVLSFVASMPLLYADEHPKVPLEAEVSSPTSYACPMHPEVIAAEPGRCPKCKMKLAPKTEIPASHVKAHAHVAHAEHKSDGLEWEDLMPELNRSSGLANMKWKLIDRESGAANHSIAWAFKVGDQVKVRLVNEMESDHPMHHPFHIHGAGRFLVLSRDGTREPNFMWKDTVLVRAGETVDILLDVSNPGLWMAHCHIAEHTESGMMFSFSVSPKLTSDQVPG
jgi:FtsP/CotA-like multicopper oxidase with cupredoxin domain